MTFLNILLICLRFYSVSAFLLNRRKFQARFAPPLAQNGLSVVDGSERLLPFKLVNTSHIGPIGDEIVEELESRSLELAAALIRAGLSKPASLSPQEPWKTARITAGKFADFCCREEGAHILESLFDDQIIGIDCPSEVIAGSVMCFQSLLVVGSQYGARGGPKSQEQWNECKPGQDEVAIASDLVEWTAVGSYRLKHQTDQRAGQQLLKLLKRKCSPQGAFNLLVELGVWTNSENVELLRSGFPIHFTPSELSAAAHITAATHRRDPDSILNIRKDLRSQKVVTIDSAGTFEIDDGLACEAYVDEGGNRRLRYWIHIADAEHYVPHDSVLLDSARERVTSHYLPEGTIPMFPSDVSSAMSLKANEDSVALSLQVELEDNGEIIDSSIQVMPSTIRVAYRLTYEDVDEMLADGVAYSEEWQIGALFHAAEKRRKWRMENGSSESFIPTQIPRYSLKFVGGNAESPNLSGLNLNVEISHNTGKNFSSSVVDGDRQTEENPVSSAMLLVTEMMILAGEAIGKWKLHCEQQEIGHSSSIDPLELPFRSQPAPGTSFRTSNAVTDSGTNTVSDYRSRSREKRIMEGLLENNVGSGYCHAWYARRFLSPVSVSPKPRPHWGLGIQLYCQWTSPIRRYSDFHVHSEVKRFIRRQALSKLLDSNETVPTELFGHEVSSDLDGVNLDLNHLRNPQDKNSTFFFVASYKPRRARMLQRNSEQYWALEYIRRVWEHNKATTLTALVLGCTNPSRRQYAIYLSEFGLEWKYISPVGLQAGSTFTVSVANVLPRNGQLHIVRVS